MKYKDGSIYLGLRRDRRTTYIEHLLHLDTDIWQGVRGYCEKTGMSPAMFINQALIEKLTATPGVDRAVVAKLHRAPVGKLRRAVAAFLYVMREPKEADDAAQPSDAEI